MRCRRETTHTTTTTTKTTRQPSMSRMWYACKMYIFAAVYHRTTTVYYTYRHTRCCSSSCGVQIIRALLMCFVRCTLSCGLKHRTQTQTRSRSRDHGSWQKDEPHSANKKQTIESHHHPLGYVLIIMIINIYTTAGDDGVRRFSVVRHIVRTTKLHDFICCIVWCLYPRSHLHYNNVYLNDKVIKHLFNYTNPTSH